MSRIIGLPESRNEQLLACKTHCVFLNWLRTNQKLDRLDVKICTMHTAYDEDLLSVYKACESVSCVSPSIQHHFCNGYANSLWTSSKEELKSETNIDQYEFIFFCRIDLILKPHFMEVFQVNPNKVLYSFNCGITFCLTGAGHPMIADTMMVVPKALWPAVRDSNMGLGHGAWEAYFNEGTLSYDQQGYLLYTMHDSDSNKDLNPLYKMANRPEATVWISKDFVIDPVTLRINKVDDDDE